MTSTTRPPSPTRARYASRKRLPSGEVCKLDVLVLDADMKQSLAAVRALGRSGLAVGVAGARGPGPPPPAFSSRWARTRAWLPDYRSDPDGYARGVIEMARVTSSPVVVPASDQSLTCLRPWRSQLELHAHPAMGLEECLAVAMDKRQTLALADRLGLPVPRTVVVDNVGDLRAAFGQVGWPAVMKPSVPWTAQRGGLRWFAQEVLDAGEAERAFCNLSRGGEAVLVQELATGRREAVCVFRAGGRLVAEFATSYLRTTPVLGGASVVRESIALPPDARRAALSLVEAMGLDGYSEVEFRRDQDGRPLVMEVNPRLSGSLELAVRSGVNFPLMTWQWASGHHVDAVTRYRTGLRLRWMAGDCSWLVENFRRRGRPDSARPVRAVAMFLGEFARTHNYDFVDKGDIVPAVTEVRRVTWKWSRALVGATAPVEPRHQAGPSAAGAVTSQGAWPGSGRPTSGGGK